MQVVVGQLVLCQLALLCSTCWDGGNVSGGGGVVMTSIERFVERVKSKRAKTKQETLTIYIFSL